MIKVYRYAILNIAASAAADNKAGCFPERKICYDQTVDRAISVG